MKVKRLESELLQILSHIESKEGEIDQRADQVNKPYRLSAKNLMRYLILRTYDLRKFHDSLSELGISSLRSSEGYVYSNLKNSIALLSLIQGKAFSSNENVESIGYKKSKKLLRKHANLLFNKVRKNHFTEIMVTLPDEAAHDKELIRSMMVNGMEIARINLSHGSLEDWTQMVSFIRELKEELNQSIKVYMDLAGPKIRTSKIEIKSKKGKVLDSINLRVGEHILLTKRLTLGKKSKFGNQNEQIEMAEIGTLLPEIIDDIKVNDQVYFDDGMIKAIVVSKQGDDVELLITEAFKTKLSSNKGINLPSTDLKLPSLTNKDIELLSFVCANADIVGYSFVRKPEDVKVLYKELEEHGNHDIGVVFKIENQEAFENLPEILLEGMKRDKIGVMIARGDLAVEIGFERISEVQNQILWLCEAAHVPVIWATQVLESLAKTGVATRAEISDAAQSAQAECVMLNKGPFIVEAIKTLKNILIKMEAHSFKKKDSLRSLNIASKSLKRMNL